MARNLVTCRVCKQKIDRDKLIENVDWIMPKKNYFYHYDCYTNWRGNLKNIASIETAKAQETDEEWFQKLKDYLYYDVRLEIDFKKLTSQWKNLLKKGRTAKGIVLSIIYFYEYMHADMSKSKGGIGIVDYIYQDAAEFWQNQVAKEADIVEKILNQIEERHNQKTIIVKQQKQNKSRKKTYELDDILAMEEDE